MHFLQGQVNIGKYGSTINERYGTCKHSTRRKKYYNDNARRHKNYLNQEFNTTAPDQVWVSDVTYFKCNNKQYYICAVIDLYARKIISYKIGKITVLNS